MTVSKVKRVHIQLLGKFKMKDGKEVIDESGIHSNMMMKLLAYIICHRQKEITVQELIENLWPDETSANPAGALKNLMYRLRNRLRKEWGQDNFILSGHGCYRWNPEIAVSVDAEEFEEYYKMALKTRNPEEKSDLEQKAVDLYKGKFLPGLSNEHWVMSLSAYYHSMYLDVVKEAAFFFEKNRMFTRMEEILQRATIIETLDEELYCLLLRAMLGGDKRSLALTRYVEIAEFLYDNLGVRPCTELQKIYNEMMKRHHEYEPDISAIQQKLKREKEGEGAFLCEYGIFTKIYELETRRYERFKIPVYLSLLSLYPEERMKRGSSFYLKVINNGMAQMQKILLNSLRYGDVITRYSVSQFLVMLPGCRCDDAKVVLERVQNNFYAGGRHVKVKIQYGLNEIEFD